MSPGPWMIPITSCSEKVGVGPRRVGLLVGANVRVGVGVGKAEQAIRLPSALSVAIHRLKTKGM